MKDEERHAGGEPQNGQPGRIAWTLPLGIRIAEFDDHSRQIDERVDAQQDCASGFCQPDQWKPQSEQQYAQRAATVASMGVCRTR